MNTSVAPAEYGRAGGAIVITSIKSGTNQFHGSAFECYRSGHFDSKPNYRFNGAPATPAASFNRNQPGFSAGGPILKNKLFIFGDYQALREVLPVPPHYLTVPTALMRGGDFSELLVADNSGGAGFQTQYPRCYPGGLAGTTSPGIIYDLTTCDYCGDFAAHAVHGRRESRNMIPTDRLNPAAVNYLNAYPTPSRTDRYLNNYLDYAEYEEQQSTTPLDG